LSKSLNEQETQKLAAQAEKLKGDTLKRENDARCQAIRENLKKIAENSRIKILVVPTNEELEIAQQTVACLNGNVRYPSSQ